MIQQSADPWEQPAVETAMPRRQQVMRLGLPSLLLLVSLSLWVRSLQGVNVTAMGDLGLLSILPLTFYLALIAVTLGFAFAIAIHPLSRSLLLAHVALVVVIVHGTPAILYSTVRYAWTYKHVGIVDYILRHGTVDPTIGYLGVYHDWPGFFALGALLTQLSGLSSALSIADWSPVFFELLALGALRLVYGTLTSDDRLAWIAIWIFSLGNWIGQDYFAPQAVSYFLYLIAIGTCLRWFGGDTITVRQSTTIPLGNRFRAVLDFLRSAPGRQVRDATGPFSLSSAGVMAMLVLLLFVIVCSHQLTPFMTVSALCALALPGVIRWRWLPILMIVMTTSWIIYPAAPFLEKNTQAIFSTFGQLAGNLNAGLTPLAHVPPSQVFVALVARTMTGLLLVLPLAGLARRVYHGYWDVACVLLVLSPIPWIATTRYGHEMLFRTFLFALPFAAFLSAAAIAPTPRASRAWIVGPLLALLSVPLLAGLCVTYYGQEQMNYFAPDEVAAVRYFDRVAPSHSLLMEGSSNTPIPFEDYERYSYVAINELTNRDRLAIVRNPVPVLLRWMRGYPRGYVLILRGQKAEVRIMGDLPTGALDRMQRALTASSRFQIVYRTKNAALFATRRQTPLQRDVERDSGS